MKIKIKYTNIKKEFKASIINIKDNDKSYLEFWARITELLVSWAYNIKINKDES